MSVFKSIIPRPQQIFKITFKLLSRTFLYPLLSFLGSVSEPHIVPKMAQTHYVAQVGPEPRGILLPQTAEWWYNRCLSWHPVIMINAMSEAHRRISVFNYILEVPWTPMKWQTRVLEDKVQQYKTSSTFQKVYFIFFQGRVIS